MPFLIVATLVVFVALCVVTDVWMRRIPNAISGPAMVLGITLNTAYMGSAGLLQSLSGLGIVIGPLLTIGALSLAGHFFPAPATNPIDRFFYPLLVVIRFFVWMLVIFVFTKHLNLTLSKLLLYASCGAVWSCLLDLPGIALAFVSPGKISFC